ncbi:nucleotidyl transferase AbiEii/AbiGii toxin family protein [Patescibacteria group bacterium]|nr:nucleotidyl transferase AbiEii/AbiGii toxin family protein [Patescibacteria group bacterium]
MLKTNQSQALHKSIMLRVLINILDDPFLSQNLYFKGGTCASMLGYLDRFSVDLDFDIKDKNLISDVQKGLEKIFDDVGLEIKDSSKNTVQYYLKYEAPENSRNTLKIDAVDVPYIGNEYEKILLPEINRFAICQTKSTLFTNKLVAIIDRHERNGSIAGRDIYDIHHFFQQGFDINEEIIKERRNTDTNTYLKELVDFIEKNITETIINQDLNFLLEPEKFNSIRKTLKDETLALIRGSL